jgi:putative FmdB family regulatory protein
MAFLIALANALSTPYRARIDFRCGFRRKYRINCPFEQILIMPTYQYQCTKCDHEFELFQSMTDKALAVCPKELCGRKSWGKGRVKKLIGAGAGLIFKGSGFYITDYRSAQYKEAAKKESAPSSSGGESKAGGGETKATPAKTESKPAAKTAKKDN